MPKISGALSNYPARVSFATFVLLILVGTLVLCQPFARADAERPITWIEAMFTCISACCVTGLTVRSTGHDFSFGGQLAILVLIQIGGIGILTITNFLMLQLGGTMQMREKRLLHETLGAEGNANLGWVLRNVIRFTLIAEAIGAFLLTVRFLFEMPWPQAVWQALFHSVSAFCNAGFSLNDNSLVDYQNDWLVNGTVGGLIVAGGIGFPVVLDLLRQRRGTWQDRIANLHLHTKIMLLGTTGFILVGAVSYWLFEWDHALKDKSWSGAILIPIFQSVTCRTAGFNTIDQAELTGASLLVSIFLMFVGGGPCSTAGGVKVTSMLMIMLKAAHRVRGRATVSIYRRTIPQLSIDKASTLILFYVFIAAIALLLVLTLENAFGELDDRSVFLSGLFEVISALGTVGLSVNLTPHLSEPSLFVLMLLMFFGRLGPVSVFAALSLPERDASLKFVAEEPLVG